MCSKIIDMIPRTPYQKIQELSLTSLQKKYVYTGDSPFVSLSCRVVSRKKYINGRVIQHENMSTIAYVHYKIIETYAQISQKYYVGVACFTKKRHKRTRDSALKHVDHTHKSLTNIMQVSRVSTNDKLSLSHLSIDRFYRCKHVFNKIDDVDG